MGDVPARAVSSDPSRKARCQHATEIYSSDARLNSRAAEAEA